MNSLFTKNGAPASDRVGEGFIGVTRNSERDKQEPTKAVTKEDKVHCFLEQANVSLLTDAKRELVFQVNDAHEIDILNKNGIIRGSDK